MAGSGGRSLPGPPQPISASQSDDAEGAKRAQARIAQGATCGGYAVSRDTPGIRRPVTPVEIGRQADKDSQPHRPARTVMLDRPARIASVAREDPSRSSAVARDGRNAGEAWSLSSAAIFAILRRRPRADPAGVDLLLCPLLTLLAVAVVR